MWTWTTAARQFFEHYLPVASMEQADGLTSGTNGQDYVFADPGAVYAVYLPDGGSATLDLRGQTGSFDVDWYDPRIGGALQDGSVTQVNGGGLVSLGTAPSDGGEDWAVLVRAKAGAPAPTPPAEPAVPGAQIGTESKDALSGATGTDHLIGRGGGDRLDGRAGADLLEGQGGNDVYFVDAAGDKVVELAGEGMDEVNSWIGYSLPHAVEKLVLRGGLAIDGTGNAGANALIGNDAANRLDGAAGQDRLTGRGGADLLAGGADADLFDYNLFSDSRGAKVDMILDFVSGEDRIDLSTLDADAGREGNQAFAFVGAAAFGGNAGELRWHDAGAGVRRLLADADGDGIADLVIDVTSASALVESDFLL